MWNGASITLVNVWNKLAVVFNFYKASQLLRDEFPEILAVIWSFISHQRENGASVALACCLCPRLALLAAGALGR